MRISHRYKFIFFCNPKTGSESVRELLGPYSDVSSTIYLKRTPENPFYSHISPVETRNIFMKFGWDFDSYTKFVFVRNPWARLVSLYEMIYQKASAGINKPDYPSWLYTVLPYGPGAGGEDWKRWRKYGSYSLDNYASDETGKLLVDKVIRLEDIDTELPAFLLKLGIPEAEKLHIPHINARIKQHYAVYYTEAAREYVARMYKYDIEHYGYEFEHC